MNIKKVHNRGILFSFEELNTAPFNCITNVYVIVSEDIYYICDTYLGPYYMKKIKQYLESNFGLKEYIVFNSHSHWDHIWGNCEFKTSTILAHQKCKLFIEKYGQEGLESHKAEFTKENVEITLPNEVFTNKKVIENDKIEFFYSPGHSEDSSSCFDYEDKTLFVGDNIDIPIPSFFDWNDLETYKLTLENYLSYNPERVVQSHGDVMSPDIIIKNINYLDDLINCKEIHFESNDVQRKHIENIRFISQLSVEDKENSQRFF